MEERSESPISKSNRSSSRASKLKQRSKPPVLREKTVTQRLNYFKRRKSEPRPNFENIFKLKSARQFDEKGNEIIKPKKKEVLPPVSAKLGFRSHRLNILKPAPSEDRFK